MIHKPISWRWKIGLGVASVALILLGYTYLSHEAHVENPDNTTIPGWGQIWDGLVKVLVPSPTGEIWFWIDFEATFFRLFVGLAIGVFASVVLGILMGSYSAVEAFFLPPLAFLAKIPPTAMMAVFFVLVGADFYMFIAIIAFGTMPTLTQAIYQTAKKDVPDELIYKAFTLGASQMEIICDIISRHILPKTLESVRLQIGPAMVFLIAAEYVAAHDGFGYRLRLQSRLLHMDVVYVYLAFLGTAGYLMDLGLIWTRRKLCPWYGK